MGATKLCWHEYRATCETVHYDASLVLSRIVCIYNLWAALSSPWLRRSPAAHEIFAGQSKTRNASLQKMICPLECSSFLSSPPAAAPILRVRLCRTNQSISTTKDYKDISRACRVHMNWRNRMLAIEGCARMKLNQCRTGTAIAPLGLAPVVIKIPNAWRASAFVIGLSGNGMELVWSSSPPETSAVARDFQMSISPTSNRTTLQNSRNTTTQRQEAQYKLKDTSWAG